MVPQPSRLPWPGRTVNGKQYPVINFVNLNGHISAQGRAKSSVVGGEENVSSVVAAAGWSISRVNI